MKATISKYLEGQRYDRKLYEKVRKAIEQLQFDATAELGMSAKTHYPLVIVRGRECKAAANEIRLLLEPYFRVGEPYWLDHVDGFIVQEKPS